MESTRGSPIAAELQQTLTELQAELKYRALMIAMSGDQIAADTAIERARRADPPSWASSSRALSTFIRAIVKKAFDGLRKLSRWLKTKGDLILPSEVPMAIGYMFSGRTDEYAQELVHLRASLEPLNAEDMILMAQAIVASHDEADRVRQLVEAHFKEFPFSAVGLQIRAMVRADGSQTRARRRTDGEGEC